MAIWIAEFEVGVLTRALLVDSVHEKALPLECFSCRADAEGFTVWCLSHAVDLSKIMWAEGTLTALKVSWDGEKCPACFTTGCACGDCGLTCDQKCAEGCREARP
jgi:hypothetical protein